MAVIRKNILGDAGSRDAYIRGVLLLKQEDSGKKTTDFGLRGRAQPVSTYDLFVIWHYRAMMTPTPPGQSSRNAAHGGPIFCPWHRLMLLLLEQNLRRVLGDANFALPYWDWGADGDRAPARQSASAIWAPDCLGGQGAPVDSGPFAFSASDPKSFRVKIDANSSGALIPVNRGLARDFGANIDALPSSAHVANALALNIYDAPDWDAETTDFRNRVEGWMADAGFQAPWMHNRVHVWVGGDMLKGTSPNDPVFYLNHCNVDRIWSAWLAANGGAYAPDMSAGDDLRGHRIDDAIVSPLGAGATPRQLLDVSALYSYDALPQAPPGVA